MRKHEAEKEVSQTLIVQLQKMNVFRDTNVHYLIITLTKQSIKFTNTNQVIKMTHYKSHKQMKKHFIKSSY